MNRIICFDLDGTVSEISRFYTCLVRTEPKNWTAFKMHIPQDKPISQILFLWKLLQDQDNVKIIVSTARDEGCREETEKWLKKHDLKYEKIFMREKGFHGDDVIVKLENAKKIEEEFGKIDMIFDDRNKVVKAYTENGYFVMDVSQGAGNF